MSKHTVTEVLSQAAATDYAGISYIGDMLRAYASMLAAQEKAEAVCIVEKNRVHDTVEWLQYLPTGAYPLYAHPPAPKGE